MYVVLSQKIDTESPYDDILFSIYHYPAKYRNQLHPGDIFIYYQGNRYNQKHRYYFGTGVIGQIVATDDNNYFASLIQCKRFEKSVPIYLLGGGYIEQLNYESIRKKENPPWQSSIRPLSEEAYKYIIAHAGALIIQGKSGSVTY